MSICLFLFSAATSTNVTGPHVTIDLTNVNGTENVKVRDLPGRENKPPEKDKSDQDKNDVIDSSHAPVQETNTKVQPKKAKDYDSECVPSNSSPGPPSPSQNTRLKVTEPEDEEDETSCFITRAEPEQPQSDTDSTTVNIALRENLMKRKGDCIV